MLKKNNFKAKNKSVYYFLSLSLISFMWLFLSFDFRKLVDSEIQEFQSFATTFSSPTQLFDEGDSRTLRDFSPGDFIPFSSNLSKAFFEGVFGGDSKELKEIKLFIKFKHLEKILKDRENALINEINTDSMNVPCKVSDGYEVFKCKIRLKGDLPDHWNTIKRMSLRIDVKGGFIHGMKEFSIQKPATRKFPYDQMFHTYNKKLGRLSSNGQKFLKVTVNGDSWGVMNAEPIIDDKFLEVNEVKRLGVFRISNQDDWSYNKINGRYEDYFISDPTVNLSMRGNENEILKSYALNEIYSHILLSLSTKNGGIFDREKMVENLVLSLVWGYIHTLENSNAWYTWNPYMQKLEPILTDQGNWQKTTFLLEKLEKLPFEYKLLLRDQNLTNTEFLNKLYVLKSFFDENDVIEQTNFYKSKIFKNDQPFQLTPIYNNIAYLEENSETIVKMLNQLSVLETKNKSIDTITADQLNNIDKPAEIIHFTDGTVRIFNLLGTEIFVESIVVDGKQITVNRVIPSSRTENLSSLEIKTNFVGSLNNSVAAILKLQDIKKNVVNSVSLNNINYSLELPTNGISFCKSDEFDKTCVLQGILEINESVTFKKRTIIESGTKIKLGESGSLIFDASVEMNGTKEMPIIIEGNKTGGIYIKNKVDEISKLQNVSFLNLSTINTFLTRFTGSINGYGGTFELKDVRIRNGDAEDQLNIVNAKVNIENLFISDAISDAFDCDFCIGSIKNIDLKRVGGDGLDISGSNLNIKDMIASDINDKALSVGENSLATIDGANYHNISTGIAVKDSSEVLGSNISLNDIEYDAFMTYVKKPFFSGITKLEIDEFEITGKKYANLCVREIDTVLLVNNQECAVSNVNIDELYSGRMKK